MASISNTIFSLDHNTIALLQHPSEEVIKNITFLTCTKEYPNILTVIGSDGTRIFCNLGKDLISQLGELIKKVNQIPKEVFKGEKISGFNFHEVPAIKEMLSYLKNEIRSLPQMSMNTPPKHLETVKNIMKTIPSVKEIFEVPPLRKGFATIVVDFDDTVSPDIKQWIVTKMTEGFG